MEATIGHWAKRIIYTATILIKLTWATIQAKHTMISATLVTHKIITIVMVPTAPISTRYWTVLVVGLVIGNALLIMMRLKMMYRNQKVNNTLYPIQVTVIFLFLRLVISTTVLIMRLYKWRMQCTRYSVYQSIPLIWSRLNVDRLSHNNSISGNYRCYYMVLCEKEVFQMLSRTKLKRK